jgi:hypothetical protein
MERRGGVQGYSWIAKLMLLKLQHRAFMVLLCFGIENLANETAVL